MDHSIIKQVIYDQREVIRTSQIVERDYFFEEGANYISVGMRRAGKSTLLYQRALELIDSGVGWDQIIYLNFEDERLVEFGLSDFNDIVQTAAELTDNRAYYFLDEVQNITGWERFARRMADAHECVYITGSNASMLSGEMAQRLGGRYLVREVMPYSFEEYLDAKGVRHDEEALYATRLNGKVRAAAETYLETGGLPESVNYQNRRVYAESVYQKVLLGDIAARYAIRNLHALRVLMKKVAETVTSDVTFGRLRKAVTATGVNCSTDAVISYVNYAVEAYLLFNAKNYVAKFSEREGAPKYYFMDNGLLALFLIDKKSLLLENAVACDLRRRHGDELWFLKSSKNRIDVDFYIPQEDAAVQVCLVLDEGDFDRETSSLVALASDERLAPKRLVIVTLSDDERIIEVGGAKIEVMPLYRWLLRK